MSWVCGAPTKGSHSVKLILTGAPRTGKSTLLRRLVDSHPWGAGGIIATELPDSDGSRAGFALQVVWKEPHGSLRIIDQAVLALADHPWPLQYGRYGVNPEALALAVRALDSAMHEGGLVVIDEIGPLQLLSLEFRDAVLRCAESPAGLAATLCQSQDPFVTALRSRPGLRVVEVTRANRRHLLDGLKTWLGK